MGWNRPRRTFEEILWFSKTHDPYVDIKACGRWSDKVSFRGSTRFGFGGNSPQTKGKHPGQTRIADVISVPVAKIQKGIPHPAMFPVELAETLIQTFCPQGGTVLDNFAGSGTTLVAAKRLGRNYYGIDVVPEFCQIARRRLDQMALSIAG